MLVSEQETELPWFVLKQYCHPNITEEQVQMPKCLLEAAVEDYHAGNCSSKTKENYQVRWTLGLLLSTNNMFLRMKV